LERTVQAPAIPGVRPARCFTHTCKPLVAAPSHPNQFYPETEPNCSTRVQCASDCAVDEVEVMRFQGRRHAQVEMHALGIDVRAFLTPEQLRRFARQLLDAAYDIDGWADAVMQNAQAAA
jgi:hypothetical protein